MLWIFRRRCDEHLRFASSRLRVNIDLTRRREGEDVSRRGRGCRRPQPKECGPTEDAEIDLGPSHEEAGLRLVAGPPRFAAPPAHATEVRAVRPGGPITMDVNLDAPATPFRDLGIRRAAVPAPAVLRILTMNRRHGCEDTRMVEPTIREEFPRTPRRCRQRGTRL
jgi:hypothetical protein